MARAFTTASACIITDESLHCPKCRYCLRGLAFQAKCPECGAAYHAYAQSIPDALRLFDVTIPCFWRLGLNARLEPSRRFEALVSTIASAAAMSALYVGLQVTATYVGLAISPEPGPQRYNTFAEFGTYGTHGQQVRISWHSVAYVGSWSFALLILLSLVVKTWYWRSAGGLREYDYVMSRLGTFAAISASVVAALPIAATTVWQGLNCAFLRAPPCTPPFLRYAVHLLAGAPGDLVMGFALAIELGTIGAAVRLFVVHRRCIRRVREALATVRTVENEVA